jgi:hypothetical protein
MPVEYPQLIKEFKVWMNANKTTASSSSELEGTKTVRSANFQEYLIAFAGDALSGNLPPGVNDSLKTVGGNVSTVLKAVPFVGEAASSGFDIGQSFVADPTKVVTAAGQGWVDSIRDYANNFYLPNAAFEQNSLTFFEVVKGQSAVLFTDALDGLSNWGSTLSGIGPEGYTIRDAIDLTGTAGVKAASFFGVAPASFSDLAGSVVNKELHDRMTAKLEALDTASRQDLSIPENLEAADTARIEAEAVAQEIIDKVAQERETFARKIAENTAIQAHFDMANYYSTLSPEEQAIYGQFMTGDTKVAVAGLSETLSTSLNSKPGAGVDVPSVTV